jgi:hypothetical protein
LRFSLSQAASRLAARAEDRAAPVEPLACGAAGPRLALVAGGRAVIEVQAASALQQIAPDRRHVPELRRRSRQERLGQHRVPAADQPVRGEAAVADPRADAHAPTGQFLDLRQRQPGDVDNRCGPLDPLAHQVDQIGAAAEELRVRLGRDRLDGGGHIGRAHVRERPHRAASA